MMYHRDRNRRRGERTGPDWFQLRDVEGRMDPEGGEKFQPGSTWIDHQSISLAVLLMVPRGQDCPREDRESETHDAPTAPQLL